MAKAPTKKKLAEKAVKASKKAKAAAKTTQAEKTPKATKATKAQPEAVASPPPVLETAPPQPTAASATAQTAEKAKPTPDLGSFAKLTAELSPEQLARMETLSSNLAKAAMTAQGALAESALRQAERPAALSPDPFHVGPALAEVASQMAYQPDALMRAQADLFQRYMELWTQTSRRAYGESATPVVAPARGDKRFNDPAWSENPVFDMMKQSYLLTSNWLNGLVSQVE